MKILFIVLLIGHAIAHLVGFVIPWKITKLTEMPYSTKIFFNILDVGDIGIKSIGILWLLASLSFIAVSVLLLVDINFWKILFLISTLFSLILTIIGLPASKIGVVVNFILLLFLFIINQYSGFTF